MHSTMLIRPRLARFSGVNFTTNSALSVWTLGGWTLPNPTSATVRLWNTANCSAVLPNWVRPTNISTHIQSLTPRQSTTVSAATKPQSRKKASTKKTLRLCNLPPLGIKTVLATSRISRPKTTVYSCSPVQDFWANNAIPQPLGAATSAHVGKI